jgi:hypothetical protein
MAAELKRIGRGLIEVLFRNFPGGTEEDHEKTQDRRRTGRDLYLARPD